MVDVNNMSDKDLDDICLVIRKIDHIKLIPYWIVNHIKNIFLFLYIH